MKRQLIYKLIIITLCTSSITIIIPQQQALAKKNDVIFNTNINKTIDEINNNVINISTKYNKEITNVSKYKDGNINIFTIDANKDGYTYLNTSKFNGNIKYIYKIDNVFKKIDLYKIDKNKSSYLGLNKINKGDKLIIADSNLLNKERIWILINNQWINISYGKINRGWLKDNKDTYYIDSNGYMYVGWLFFNGKWYHFSESGVLTKGWLLDVTGKWYFFNKNGQMLKKQYIDSYYLSDDGSWNITKSIGNKLY